jgi:hypothetical protein
MGHTLAQQLDPIIPGWTAGQSALYSGINFSPGRFFFVSEIDWLAKGQNPWIDLSTGPACD